MINNSGPRTDDYNIIITLFSKNNIIITEIKNLAGWKMELQKKIIIIKNVCKHHAVLSRSTTIYYIW